ncbi:hypothetical protein ABZ502_15155 [Streptomyces abikoensis]|uniref:hypothetical protein n=1 Tax=Streptomyces abikoensis TaxID=97398 RepID=UPI0033D42737
MRTAPYIDPDDPRLREAMAFARAVTDLRQEALFNFGEMTGVKLTAVLGQMLEHSELPDSYLKTVKAVFAAPDGYREMYEKFETPGSVIVLPREPGAGRVFTAHALLADLRYRTGARVGPLGFGGTQRFPVRRIPLDRNIGYLLDLPVDEETFAIGSEFGADLRDVQKRLEPLSSRLVVLAAPQQWERIRHGAPQDVVPFLAKPQAEKVAEAWLRAEAPGLDVDAWLADSRIKELLAGQSPADALQIVSLIVKANRFQGRADLKGGADFNRQVLDVVAARRNWREDLLTWHRGPQRTGFERNFLLVASLLRNAPVAHVYAQTATLCTSLGDPYGGVEGQSAPGVIEMVDAIEASLGDDDTIQFSKPGWDDAVLSYFWLDRPMARKSFLAWMAKAPTEKTTEFLETFSIDDRKYLAHRVGSFAVRWAARHRKGEPLEAIALAWGKDDVLWQAAVDLISAAALHPTMGRFIHEQLLSWSKQTKDEKVALRRMTVDICAGEFGRRHTGKALRRLGYAAASPHSALHLSLRKAVRNLWTDASVRSTLFDAVISWCSDGQERTESGRRAFSALATLTQADNARLPVLLAGKADDADFEPSVEKLSSGWRTLLDPALDDEEASGILNLWMDAAWLFEDRRPVVFSALRGAVDVPGKAGGGHPRHRLRDLLYRWQPVPSADADPQRVHLRHELADLLDHDRSRAVEHYKPRPGSREASPE